MAEIFTNGVLWINYADVSCYFRSVEINQDVDMHDSTTFCTNGARTFKAGLVERGITAEGFWDDEEELGGGVTLDGLMSENFHYPIDVYSQVLTFAHSSEVGSPAVLLSGYEGTLNVTTSVGELAILNYEAKATKSQVVDGPTLAYGAFKNGRVLFNQEVSATVNGTTFDAGNPAFDSGNGYVLHVHFNGSIPNNIEIKLQHSTNGSSWVDLATIANNGELQKVITSGTIERYRRVIISEYDGDPTRVFVAMARNGIQGDVEMGD